MRHCAYLKHIITNFEEKMSQKTDFTEERREKFDKLLKSGEFNLAFEQLFKTNHKFSKDELLGIHKDIFQIVNVGNRWFFWMEHCKERDQLLETLTNDDWAVLFEQYQLLEEKRTTFQRELRKAKREGCKMPSDMNNMIKSMEGMIFPLVSVNCNGRDAMDLPLDFKSDLLDSYFQCYVHFNEWFYCMKLIGLYFEISLGCTDKFIEAIKNLEHFAIAPLPFFPKELIEYNFNLSEFSQSFEDFVKSTESSKYYWSVVFWLNGYIVLHCEYPPKKIQRIDETEENNHKHNLIYEISDDDEDDE